MATSFEVRCDCGWVGALRRAIHEDIGALCPDCQRIIVPDLDSAALAAVVHAVEIGDCLGDRGGPRLAYRY